MPRNKDFDKYPFCPCPKNKMGLHFCFRRLYSCNFKRNKLLPYDDTSKMHCSHAFFCRREIENGDKKVDEKDVFFLSQSQSFSKPLVFPVRVRERLISKCAGKPLNWVHYIYTGDRSGMWVFT